MVATEIKDYDGILDKFYWEDPELIKYYHIVSNGNNTIDDLNRCVNDTLNVFKVATAFKFFKLSDNKGLIGYFGTQQTENHSMLSGFFIRPKYRKKQYVRKFWRIIDNNFGGKTYFCGVYAKNTRALAFLDKKGEPYDSVKVKGNDVIMFKIN